MKQQRGGTILGFILGLVVGLGIALAVAVYVTKVPVPFLHKGQSRTPEQDAAEIKKNKGWEPNAPLSGKSTKPSAGEVLAPATPASGAKAENKPAVSADPLGDLAKAKSAAPAAEPFIYFVQAGAFRTAEDAESQRAKLSLAGVEAKAQPVVDQAGRTVYRVRVGPFDKRDDAEKIKTRLDAAHYETVLVRAQR